MAIQDGILKFKGKIGELTFYKTKDGYSARKKGGIDGNRIKNDPSFIRTRENGEEFGRAGAASKVIRTALRSFIKVGADSRMTGRLTKTMLTVIKADAVSVRGKRNVIDGEVEFMKGFEFNNNGKLTDTLLAPFTPVIDRATGNMTVEVTSFVPQDMLNKPEGATHYRLISVAFEANFEAKSVKVVSMESAFMIIGPQVEPALTLTNTLGAGTASPLFLTFGIEFFQNVNGSMYHLRNGAFNALAIIEVEPNV